MSRLPAPLLHHILCARGADAFRAGAHNRQPVCTDAPPRQLDADLGRSAMPDGTLGDYHRGVRLNYICC